MTFSNMLLSPHVADVRQDVEYWVHLLHELGNILIELSFHQTVYLLLFLAMNMFILCFLG